MVYVALQVLLCPAIRKYCEMWDYSDSMKEIFHNNVEYEKVTIIQETFCNKQIDRTAKE